MILPEEIKEMIVAFLSGNSPEADERLKGWLQEDPRHQELFTEIQVGWHSARWGAALKNFPKEGGWERILDHRRRVYRRRWLVRISAAASLLLLAGMGWWWWPAGAEVDGQLSSIQRKEAIVTLTLSEGEQRVIGKKGTEEIVDKGSVLRADSAHLVYTEPAAGSGGQEPFHELNVPAGGEFRLTLSDGSHVIVNSQTKVRYPLAFTGEVREVWLEGEACFEVAADEHKPFIVHTSKADVRVLGTLFNVSVYRDDPKTLVTLVEGVVRVDAGERQAVLAPGKQFVMDNTRLTYTVNDVDARQSIAWIDGLFFFDAKPLEELMVQLGRWFDLSWEFSDEALKRVHYSGGIRKYDNISHILNVIGEATDISFSMEHKKVIINRK